MKKTIKQWEALITAEHKGRGKNAYWEASCPICHYTKAVDILGSLAAAKTVAENRVAAHIVSEHSEMIEEKSR